MPPAFQPLTEIEKRACISLSTLFLDCEMTASKIDEVARSLQPLHMPLDQLDKILYDDVFPVLYPNLVATAGIWDAFDENELINRVDDRRIHPPGIIQNLASSAAATVLSRSVTPTWNNVKKKLRQLDQEGSS
ncbi:hypothetical protein V2G26_019859 [Clonostachys chloroleuca]